MRRVTVFKRTFRRACAAVIVHDQRVFLIRVEMRGQIIASVDRVACGSLEVPVAHFAQRNIFQDRFRQVFQADSRVLFQVDGVKALRVGSTFAEVNQFGSRGGDREIRQDIFFQRNGVDLSVGRVEYVQADTVFIFSLKVDLLVVYVPDDGLDRRVEVFAYRGYLFAGQVVDEQLTVGGIRCLSRCDVQPDAAECFSRTFNSQLRPVGGEAGGTDERVFQDLFCLHRLQIHPVKSRRAERALCQGALAAGEQQVTAVFGNIVDGCRVMSVSETFEQTCC